MRNGLKQKMGKKPKFVAFEAIGNSFRAIIPENIPKNCRYHHKKM